MANRNIRDFFKPVQSHPAEPSWLSSSPATATTSRSASSKPSPSTAVTSMPATSMPATSMPSPALGTTPAVNTSVIQRVVRSSDDEESDSDSSIEDITDFIQNRSSKSHGMSPQPAPFQTSKNSRSRSIRKNVYLPPSPARPKYKFDMKMLINQAEKDDAAEASALRVTALLNEAATKSSGQGNNKSPDVNNNLLKLVVADADDAQTEDVFQALKRTEATISEKRCYFFNTPSSTTLNVWPLSKKLIPEGWQGTLRNAKAREQTVLSGFGKDMVSLGDVLPDELFLWMLDETCLEAREDLRKAYYDILTASPQQLFQLVRPETVTKLFEKMGASGNAVAIRQEIELVPVRQSVYEGRDWTRVRAFVTFLGQISPYVAPTTRSHSLSLLVRICVDRAILENLGLLDTFQRSMEKICASIGSVPWEQCCRDICSSIYFTVQSASLRFQILRCMPRTTPRLHDLRRRLALACFFEDTSYSTRSPEVALDLYEITKRLDESYFQISRGTDYHKLAAQMGMLDILVDNGVSPVHDIADLDGEKDFNSDIDRLITRVRNTASNISDAGAAYMSRVDAKEIMEGFRHRLNFAVRTKPQPRKGIFDSKPIDESDGIRKQSELMKKHFKQIKAEVD